MPVHDLAFWELPSQLPHVTAFQSPNAVNVSSILPELVGLWLKKKSPHCASCGICGGDKTRCTLLYIIMYNVLYIIDVYVLYYYIHLVLSPSQIPQFVTFTQKLLYLLILNNNFTRCNSHTITFILLKCTIWCFCCIHRVVQPSLQLILFFLAMLHGLLDLSSSTRDQTCSLGSERAES